MKKSNSGNNMSEVTALYLRISREDGNDESLSIDNQKKLLTDIAKKINLTNIKCYIDDGVTGTKLDREQFMMMCDDISKGLVKTVMVKDLSRLSRDKSQANDLVEKFFPEHDIRFISISDGTDSNEGEDEFLGFRTLVNEWYSRDISKKRRLTNIVKGNAGEPLSPPPYGYVRDPANPKRWVIDAEPAEVVRRIYAMYLSGYGIEQIAAALSKDKELTPIGYSESMGLKKSKGKRKAETEPTCWGHSTVNKILGLQEYCGDVINFKTFSKSFKLKKRIENTEANRAKTPGMHKHDNKMKVFKDAHEAVIDRATWEKVQSKRGNTRKRVSRDGVKNIFSGFLVCSDCGGNLNFHFNQGNHDIKYFNCANNNRARKTCASTHYIRADFLEQIILREVQRLTAFADLHEKEFVRMVQGFSQQAEASDMKRKEKELNKLTSRNKEIDKLFERLYEDNVSGKVPDERYYKMSANYEAEQGENNKRVKVLRDELQREQGQQYAADSFISVVRKYTNPQELTQMMLSEMIEKIEVYHAEKIDGVTVQRLNIHYNCVGEVELPEFAETSEAVKIHTRKGVDVVYSPKSRAV